MSASAFVTGKLLCPLFLAPPLDRAADGRMLLLRPGARVGNLHHGVEELAPRIRHRLAPRRVEPAVVLELQRSVESIEFGRAHHAIGARYVLRLVDHVRKGEA